MDNLFSTNKSGKSSQGHTCCQVFVRDKGFVYVVLLKSKYKLIQVVKQFYKEIGYHEAIIYDMAV